jgi:hypothetical protein
MTLRKDVKKTLDKTVQRVSTTELVALHFVTFSFFLRIAFFLYLSITPVNKIGNRRPTLFFVIDYSYSLFLKNVFLFYPILYFQ